MSTLDRVSRRAARLVLLLASGLAACHEPAAPTWRALARGAVPHLAPLAGEGWRIEPAARPGAAWLVLELGAEDWQPGRLPGTFETALPIPDAVGRPDDGAPRRLVLDGLELEDLSERIEVSTLGSMGPGFAVFGERLHVLREAGRTPGAATLHLFVDGGRADEDGTWRVRWNRFAGDGLPLWPGGRREVSVQDTAGVTLRFATAVRTPLARGRFTFRVLGDGQPLLEVPVEVDSPWTIRWHALPLEHDVRSLAFTLEGPVALTAVVAPTLGPTEVGAPARRPWSGAGAGARNAVLLIADTLRADNLAVYGGPEDLTPHLNALADDSLVFRQAWSASTWTLPSHASMFTGLTPPQHGATDSSHALGASVETLAERYRAAGYRTVAVTESLYVSSDYGLDQGYECFDELWGESDTLVRRLQPYLDADDGRPLFLTVHTYRAHSPYSASEASRAVVGDLAPEETADALMAAIERESVGWQHGDPVHEALAHAARRFEQLYRVGVRDTDRLLGAVLDVLRAAGLLDTGVLAFTSDHGEAFGAHDELYHGNTVFEELLAVPFLLHGPGLAPTVSDTPVSLLDLPRTLAAATGLDPAPSWGGVVRLERQPPGPVVAYGSYETRRPLEAALRSEDRKIVVRLEEDADGAPRLRLAFDLALDPAETRDRSDEGWARALLEQQGEVIRAGLESHVEPSPALLDARELQRLRALGYVE